MSGSREEIYRQTKPYQDMRAKILMNSSGGMTLTPDGIVHNLTTQEKKLDSICLEYIGYITKEAEANDG